MPGYRAVCNGCGAEAIVQPGENAHEVVQCAPDSGCCQIDHGPGSHAGPVCDRTLTHWAEATLIAVSGQE